MDLPPVVRVEWVDCAYNAGATFSVSEARKFGPLHIQTVGFLIQDGKNGVVVAKEVYDDEETVRHVTAIPRPNIIKVEMLAEALHRE